MSGDYSSNSSCVTFDALTNLYNSKKRNGKKEKREKITHVVYKKEKDVDKNMHMERIVYECDSKGESSSVYITIMHVLNSSLGFCFFINVKYDKHMRHDNKS